jgi:hypothetical protein
MESIHTHSESLDNNHLKSRELQIITCLDIIEDANPPEDIDPNNLDIVDLYSSQEDANKIGAKKSKEIAYVISDINDHDKISSKYKNCTGVILSGIDKQNKKPISLITHQNPGYILHGEGEDFIVDLQEAIKKFKSQCEEKTIDTVIIGGQVLKFKGLPDTNPAQKLISEEYKNFLRLVSELLQKEFGFTPIVVGGPKTDKGTDMLIYKNDTRRLFLYRNKNAGDFSGPFKASTINQISKTFTPGEVTVEEYLGKKKKEEN